MIVPLKIQAVTFLKALTTFQQFDYNKAFGKFLAQTCPGFFSSEADYARDVSV